MFFCRRAAQIGKLLGTRVTESRLSVDTTPASARISILNITHPYVQGLALAQEPMNLKSLPMDINQFKSRFTSALMSLPLPGI
ncbi:MAG: hypothetical protein KJ630_01585 [Proteobacteria bacterium]|nr:hypothetical protein [Pseudomonadota bacterium]